MPTATATRLIQQRGPLCECCRERAAMEAHHCLYNRRRGVPQLDQDENLALVCRSCHHVTGRAKSWRFRERFWQIQCFRYGHDHMVQWHNALPLKVKKPVYK